MLPPLELEIVIAAFEGLNARKNTSYKDFQDIEVNSLVINYVYNVVTTYVVLIRKRPINGLGILVEYTDGQYKLNYRF